MEATVLHSQVITLVIQLSNVVVFLPDNGRKVLQLLHLLQILVTFLVDCLKVLVV